MKRLAVRPIVLDSIAHTGLGAATGLSAAFFPVVAVRLGADPWLLALITSVPFFANLLAPAWASEARRLGTRWMVVASLSAAALVLLLLPFAGSALSFALLAALYHLFYGVLGPLYVSMSEVAYPRRTGEALGGVEAAFNIAQTAASAVAGWLMDLWGLLATSVIASVSTGIASAAYAPFPDGARDPSSDETAIWDLVRRDPMLRHMNLVFMVAGTGMVMMLPAFPLVAVEQLDLSNSQVGLLLAGHGLALVVAYPLWGRVGERSQSATMLLRWGLASMLGMALLYGFGDSFAALLVANVLCGIGGAAVAVGWRLFAIRFAERDTLDLAGWHLFTCGLRGLYGPALGAVLISLWNTSATFIVAAGLIAGGLVMLLIGPPKQPSDNRSEAGLRNDAA